jgi:hypothetical protein
LRPVRTGVALAITLRRLYGERFEADKMERLLRDPDVLEAIKAAKPLDSVTSLWRLDEEAFKERRAQYLMYEAKER